MRPGRYAAIDIGTVTCRMLVADVDATGLHELDREYAITNLGEGVDATGELKPAAMQRVAAVIDSFNQVLVGFRDEAHPVIDVTALATSASRDARNAAQFVALLADRGIELSVIPGEREAGLSFSGASCDYPGEHLLVVDIGGGSTEIVAGRSGADPEAICSFNVGCRRVTEKFFAADPPSEAELDEARRWINETMDPFFEGLRAETSDFERLIAVAGTATTVVSIQEAMETYDTARVHGYVVERDVLDSVYERLVSVPLEQRRAIVGLDPGRAEVIVAGMVIMQTVLDLAGMDSFTVSESDILHGIILDAAHARA